MKEAAALRGPFTGWSTESRNRPLRQLVEVIGRYPFTVIHCTMELAGFAKTVAGQFRKPLNQIYFFPFQVTILAMCEELLEQGQTERFEIIFDENDILGPLAKALFPVVKAAAEAIDPDARTILPVEPMLKSDDEFLPLQAADMLAWLFRRAWSQPVTSAFEYGWIATELQKSIPMSAHSQFVPKERVAFWVSLSKSPEFAAEAIRVIKEYRDREGLAGYLF